MHPLHLRSRCQYLQAPSLTSSLLLITRRFLFHIPCIFALLLLLLFPLPPCSYDPWNPIWKTANPVWMTAIKTNLPASASPRAEPSCQCLIVLNWRSQKSWILQMYGRYWQVVQIIVSDVHRIGHHLLTCLGWGGGMASCPLNMPMKGREQAWGSWKGGSKLGGLGSTVSSTLGSGAELWSPNGFPAL